MIYIMLEREPQNTLIQKWLKTILVAYFPVYITFTCTEWLKKTWKRLLVTKTKKEIQAKLELLEELREELNQLEVDWLSSDSYVMTTLDIRKQELEEEMKFILEKKSSK